MSFTSQELINDVPFFQRQRQTANSNLMTERMLHIIQKYYTRYQSSIKANNVVSGISMVIVPFMNNVLKKYDEVAFHRAMSTSYRDELGNLCFGFDFVNDFRKNHSVAFSIILPIARSRRKDLDFNIDIATQMIIDIMTEAWRWHLSAIERQAIRHNVYRVKRLIQ